MHGLLTQNLIVNLQTVTIAEEALLSPHIVK